jgi:glycosyl transferase, family 25
MKAYVISLASTPGRLEKFARSNAGLGIEFIHYEAVDGSRIDRDALWAAGEIAERDLGITDNAIGCALSHMALWRMARDENRAITICEDDAVLRGDFVSVYERQLAAQPDFDILHWGFNFDMHACYEIPGYGECVFMADERQLRAEHVAETFRASQHPVHLYRAVRLYGLPCYTVSPAGADKLLKLCRPLSKLSTQFELPNGYGGLTQLIFATAGIDFFCVSHLKELNAHVAIPSLAITPNDKSQSTINGHEQR